MPEEIKVLRKAIPSSIDQALEDLRTVMQAALADEQRRDQLTGLPNDHALTAWIQDQIDAGEGFWIAFIEIDRFKSINDKFGYDDADLLLIRLADQLRRAAADFFVHAPTPFRAHGDEFYLAGILPQGSTEQLQNEYACIAERLNQILGNIGAIRIGVHEKSDPITCTVSIGWLVSDDLQDNLTARRVRNSLELAMSRAKVQRNTSERFLPELCRVETLDGRSDCGVCGSKYSVTIKVDLASEADLFCPHCGEKGTRPYSLRAANQIVVTGV